MGRLAIALIPLLILVLIMGAVGCKRGCSLLLTRTPTPTPTPTPTSKSSVRLIRIAGTAMEPTLKDGDLVMAESLTMDDIKRGDIVIYSTPAQPEPNFIKRIIGLPGETVEVESDGSVYIDGQLLEELYISANIGGPNGTWAVPESQYFLMGDNRAASHDSREHGTVLAENITRRIIQ